MKIKHIWSVLCKESIINQDDNIISLNGIMEELTISVSPKEGEEFKMPEKINLPVVYEIVSLWTKENGKEPINVEVKYTLAGPKNSDLMETIQPLEFPANVNRFRSRMKITGIAIEGAGKYLFKVLMREGKEGKFVNMSELPLEIKINIEKPS